MRSFLLPLCLLALGSPTLASLERVLDAAPSGASLSTGGSYSLSATVGQPAAAVDLTGPHWLHFSGFAAFDQLPPLVLTKDITVQLQSGTVTIQPQDVDNGSTDNFGGTLQFFLDVSTFNSFNVGENTVTLTAQDTRGHVASALAIVTVEPEPSAVGDWMVLEE